MGRPSHAKEKLQQVTSDLIWDNTYVSVSVNQICQRANVHKGSFYHFFRTKADLAIAACEMRWQEAQPELDRIFSPQVPALERFSEQRRKKLRNMGTCVVVRTPASALN